MFVFELTFSLNAQISTPVILTIGKVLVKFKLKSWKNICYLPDTISVSLSTVSKISKGKEIIRRGRYPWDGVKVSIYLHVVSILQSTGLVQIFDTIHFPPAGAAGVKGGRTPPYYFIIIFKKVKLILIAARQQMFASLYLYSKAIALMYPLKKSPFSLFGRPILV